MKINTYVSQRTFTLKDLNEKEMRLLYHMFNVGHQYFFSEQQQGNLDCEVCPPCNSPEEAEEIFKEMGKKVFDAQKEV